MNAQVIERFVSRKTTEKEVFSIQLKEKQTEVINAKKRMSDLTEARRIIVEVSKDTLEQFKEYVESLVTTAINSVFPEKGYRFIVDPVVKSNRSEIYLLVQQGDKEPYIPKDEQGGALLDIISFSLRVVLWSLELPRSRNTLIMDEPFRWSGALTTLAAQMMKEVSHELGLQIILVTHDERLKAIADRSWDVYRGVDGGSVVRQSDVVLPAGDPYEKVFDIKTSIQDTVPTASIILRKKLSKK